MPKALWQYAATSSAARCYCKPTRTFFITDRYRDYPMILVRLNDKIRADAMPDLVERAWRLQAPKKLIDELSQNRVRSLTGPLAGKN